MAQSAELAAGAGFTFEDHVAANYLTALLQEGYAPGIDSRVVSRVALQQRSFGEPLDDLIVDFRASDGTPARLSLQVKRSLTISQAPTNTDFREIIRDSWATLHKPDFRFGIDRYGAAVGETASERSRGLRSLCELARANSDVAGFRARFEEDGNASALIREINADITALIEQTSGTTPSAGDLHSFLAHFVLIEFDYLHEGGTSLPTALNALQDCLAPGHQSEASAVWALICQLAREEAGRSGAFDRKRLVLELSPKVRLAAGRSLRGDIEQIRTLTRQWLTDVEDDIGGVRLERESLLAELETTLQTSRVVQVRGLPGNGKSVLLRRRAERELATGPVLLLKSGRLDGTGWVSFATANGLSSAPLEALLVEIGATGSAILYIDGIDRVEKQHQAIIRDVVHAILSSPLLERWRIIISLRDTGIEPLRNWVSELLATKGLGTVEVKAFDDADAERLAAAKPHLHGLLFGHLSVQEIVRRPFFAKILDQNFGGGSGNSAFQPRSEVDLIENWWDRGGYDASGQTALNRQRAIIELGALRARHLDRELAIHELSPAATTLVRQFVTDGILRDARRGHSVQFAHDIFFEWAFFHVLVDQGTNWLAEIRARGEPPAVGRVVELYSQLEFRNGSNWAPTLLQIEAAGMRSQWTRAWLLAPLGAPDFDSGYATFAQLVEAEDFRLLKKALVWFQAEKTTPNPRVLAGDMPQEQRIRFADLLGWPSDFAAWRRFIIYLLVREPNIPIALFPDMMSIFEVWQNAVGGLKNPISNRILDTVAQWLAEIDGPLRDDEAEEIPAPSRWGGLRNADDFRKSLVNMLLRFSTMRADLVTAYLERVLSSERLRRDTYGEIIAWASIVTRTHANQIVDLTLKHLKEELPEDRRKREEEEARMHSEYLAQVRAKPEEERTESEQRFLDTPYFGWGGSDFSYHDWEALSVDRDFNFSPPSPLREPFHSLFEFAPDEGLRLVRELSNHAIAAWRQLHKLVYDTPGTPIPLELVFPWGTQIFWGGDREYRWHRGMWAPRPIACAYVALEAWGLSEVDKGRPADDLIQTILAGNECIAILGTAATIARQTETISETVFPLITSQRLLSADHSRMLHDMTDASSNLIGFRDESERPHYEAVKAANERPVRRTELQRLVSGFYLLGGPAFHERTRAAVLAFPDHLPYEMEEHRNVPEARESFLRQAREFAELVEVENYRRVAIDGNKDEVGIVHVSPSASTPERIERAKEAGKRLQESGLWFWASKYFESNKVADQFTVSRAIQLAKDASRIADPGGDQETRGTDIEGDMRRGAVAAVAAVVLAAREGVSEADLAWARDTVAGAAVAPEKRDVSWTSMAIIPWHPGISAARGIAADIRHGTADQRCAENLLALVAHPLEAVSLAAVREALSLWDVDPRLGWMALFVGFALCHIQPRTSASPSEPIHSPQEIGTILDSAFYSYRHTQDWPALPLPPPAWVKSTGRGRRTRHIVEGDEIDRDDVVRPGEEWREPAVSWYSRYAASILSAALVGKILSSAAKPHFLLFMTGLLAWTSEKLCPPWIKPGRRSRDSARLYEWTPILGRALGVAAGYLPLSQVKTSFLDPIFALEGDHCWELLSPFVSTYIAAHVFDSEQMPADAEALLRLALERMLEASAFDPSSYRAGELYNHDLPQLADALMFTAVEYASGAARYVNGDWSDISRILPIVDRYVRAAGWAPTIMNRHLMLCARAKTAYPPELFADQILDVVERQAASLKGWSGTVVPARIAELVQYFADQETSLPSPLGQKLLRILDALVDMGDRRSAALQLSETFREIQITP